jgi:hypothetical protein
MACMEGEAMFRAYLLDTPAERDKLTEEEARYYGFRRDKLTGRWVDARADAFRAEAVEPTEPEKPAGQ